MVKRIPLLGIVLATGLVAAAETRPIVETATVDGIIHPVSAEFIRGAIARADELG